MSRRGSSKAKQKIESQQTQKPAEQQSARSKTMFQLQRFFITERVGSFLENVNPLGRRYKTYDIRNPETQQQLATARQGKSNKQGVAWEVEVKDRSEKLVFSIRCIPGSLFSGGAFHVYDADDQDLGCFKTKWFMSRSLRVFGLEKNCFAQVKPHWNHVDRFHFRTSEGDELGKIRKKWAGIAKELLTKADNYLVTVNDNAADDAKTKTLLLAAAITIDLLFHSH